MNYLADMTKKPKASTKSTLVAGYMFASLGRSLLHGDSQSTGKEMITSYQLRLNDFIVMQAAYLKLYIDTYGKEYSRQLNYYIPIAFEPSFTVYPISPWKEIDGNEFEPFYTSLRNWMFTESSNLIDFGPYRPLVAIPAVRHYLLTGQSISFSSSKLMKPSSRRILIDVGANGFFASPKYLLDSYAPFLPFTDAIMVEPEPHFSATVPSVYSTRYNITFLPIYAEVGTDSATDMLRLLPTLARKEDFVVLKFDVDPNK